MILADVCVRRPVFATMLVGSLVVVGWFSYKSLTLDLFPKVDMPVVTVTTTLPGAGPDEMEAQVTKPIEEVINTVSGIDELRSVTREGLSQIIVQFKLEKNLGIAAQEVRDKVGSVLARLPDDTDPPIVEKFDVDATPILTLTLSGFQRLKELTEIAEKKVKEPLESISGVGAVSLIGGRKREIQVLIDPERLKAYNLPMRTVAEALAKQNVEFPGGRMTQETGETVIRTLGRVQSVREFEDIVVASHNGSPITIADIGRVEDGVVEPRTVSRFDGKNAVSLIVRKQSGTNTVTTVDAVRERLSEVRQLLPPGVEVQITRDQSDFIRESVHEVQKHLWLGALFASIIVLFFLGNIRSTLIAAVSIPVSIIATYTLLAAAGYSLNRVTLLGLTLAVGIVIDDAIVVLENIYRYIEEKGMSAFEAARAATAEVGLAVSATTLSLVVIFIPVGFLKGTIGMWLSSFGFTMAFAILVSLLVAFTLTPMLCSRFLPQRLAAHSRSSRDSWLYRLVDRAYTAMLRWSLRHRWLIIGAALGVFASTPWIGKHVHTNMMAQDDRGEFEINIKTPPGYSLAQTDTVTREIENEIRPLPGVAHLLSLVGSTVGESVTRASIIVKLHPYDQRRMSQQDLMALAREKVKAFKQLRVSVDNILPVSGSGVQNVDIAYNLRGPDLHVLQELVEKLKARVREIKGIVDVDSTFEGGNPELQVHLDRRKASDLNIEAADIASTLRIMVAGEKVTTYREGDELYDVRLRLTPESRNKPEVLRGVTVPSKTVGQVRLDNVVNLIAGVGPVQIDRQERQRQITMTGNLKDKGMGDALTQIGEEVKKMGLPVGYTTGVTGMGKMFNEMMDSFKLAFLLSIIGMYMVLAAQFESFVHPITIMLALPMAVPFALLSLWIANQYLAIFSILGVMLLFGIVKKNSILQIDHTIHLRAQGLPRDEAILQANRERLRPILMTTMALVAGMVPVLLGQGPAAASHRGIAVVIIGGQSMCLLLTLVVTPVAYALFDDLETRLARFPALLRRLVSKLRLCRPALTSPAPRVGEEIVGD
ncbi:MAG TPA: efflux RND transporter permease subunit [Methylomirabilota bacterium]|jgi:HAE1 family hydrophobic/amphiphilic exporter-1|nr:efflux RND transporter permease subunit [Methylomirabilota bacterium]